MEERNLLVALLDNSFFWSVAKKPCLGAKYTVLGSPIYLRYSP